MEEAGSSMEMIKREEEGKEEIQEAEPQ
jgi:hypothetical protein